MPRTCSSNLTEAYAILQKLAFIWNSFSFQRRYVAGMQTPFTTPSQHIRTSAVKPAKVWNCSAVGIFSSSSLLRLGSLEQGDNMKPKGRLREEEMVKKN